MDLAIAAEAHELGTVEDQADVVEGGGDEAAGADSSAVVLEIESLLKLQRGKEDANTGDKQLQLGALLGATSLMVDFSFLSVEIAIQGGYHVL